MSLIATTPVSEVLSRATGEPEKTPLQVVAERATKKRNTPKKKPVIRPAARNTNVPRLPKPKLVSVAANQIVAACDLLGFVAKRFNNDASVVIKMPSIKSFIASQPKTGATDTIRFFIQTFKALEELTGDAKATWVIHASGSFALYSKIK